MPISKGITYMGINMPIMYKRKMPTCKADNGTARLCKVYRK